VDTVNSYATIIHSKAKKLIFALCHGIVIFTGLEVPIIGASRQGADWS
jgi:hypothetical protein